MDNGLLLSATYDQLFDPGLIKFDKAGKKYLSSFIDLKKREAITSAASYPLFPDGKRKDATVFIVSC